MATIAIPRTTGRTPLSPLRTRTHQARKYWPSDWARSSGGTSAAARSAAVGSIITPPCPVPVGVSPGSAVKETSDTGHAPCPAPRLHVNQHCSEQYAAWQDVLQRRRQLTQAEKGHAIGDGADHYAAKNSVDRLAPAAEQAHAADDGGGNRVQNDLTWVCGIGAVLTVEKGTKQDPAQAGGRRAQGEGPDAYRGQADAGAAGRFGITTDGVDVAAEAGPLQQHSQSAKENQDDRNHPRNALHLDQRCSAVAVADQHDGDPDERHQGDSDGRHAGRRSGQTLPSLPGRAQPQGRPGGSHHNGQGDPTDNRDDQALHQVIDNALVCHRRVDAHCAVGPAEDDDENSGEQQESAQGHDERRNPEPSNERPLEGADHAAARERREYRRPPRPVGPRLLDELESNHAADKSDRADREVDLAEQQDYRLRHRQHHINGAQPEDVDEVARPQKCVLGGDYLEDDGDQHDGQNYGQDTAVATADPKPPRPDVLA